MTHLSMYSNMATIISSSFFGAGLKNQLSLYVDECSFHAKLNKMPHNLSFLIYKRKPLDIVGQIKF